MNFESRLSPQVSARVADPQSVDVAIGSRFSTRAFLPQAVERSVLEEVLRVAAQSPSGVNTQPWKIYVVQGARRDQIVQEACAAHDAIAADPALAAQYPDAYDYYPQSWFSPFLERRRECGLGLYSTIGIGKGDKQRMHEQHQRNFRFFDAPVGLFCTMDKQLGRGSLLDCGMFLQTLMIAARSRGLHTCPQAAWLGFSSIVMPLIGAPDNEMLVCGMALGHADPSDPVNTFQTSRLALQDFATWVD